jgi:hypothetical protein
MMEPTGLGDDPQVRITVASSARLLANRQVQSVRNTIRSRFSIVAPLAVPLIDSRHNTKLRKPHLFSKALKHVFGCM